MTLAIVKPSEHCLEHPLHLKLRDLIKSFFLVLAVDQHGEALHLVVSTCIINFLHRSGQQLVAETLYHSLVILQLPRYVVLTHAAPLVHLPQATIYLVKGTNKDFLSDD